MFGPDGRYTLAFKLFSTKEYESEAFRLVLEEANAVARQLDLPEQSPISCSNLASAFILGYGDSQVLRAVGNVHTRDFGYFVSVGFKLSYVTSAHSDRDCAEWAKRYQWPASLLDTNGAYQLARRWLSSAKMDVDALNRDCTVRIEPERSWNRGLKKGTFIPIYDVAWLSPKNVREGFGDIARVCLFLPGKSLVDLSVRDSKYILREPLSFTNLDVLLSGTPTIKWKPPDTSWLSNYPGPMRTSTNLDSLLTDAEKASSPRLTRTLAVAVATGVAREHQAQLEKFRSPSAHFDSKKSEWRVLFKGKGGASDKGHSKNTSLEVLINDKSGECSYEMFTEEYLPAPDWRPPRVVEVPH
jgi:hypothetical protein